MDLVLKNLIMFIFKEIISVMKFIIIMFFIFFVISVNELFFISWGGGGRFIDLYLCIKMN